MARRLADKGEDSSGGDGGPDECGVAGVNGARVLCLRSRGLVALRQSHPREFVALLVRISFWRSNPFHGLHKLADRKSVV